MFKNATFLRGGKVIGSSRGIVAVAALLAAASLPAFGQPSVVSALPASGSGSGRTFTLTVADSAGAGNISYAYFLVNSSLSAAGGCFVEFNHVPNTFRLQNDAGSGWLGPITLGSTASLSNSQCTITGNGASSTATGNNLALTIPTTFAFAFGGAKTVFGYAYDSAFTGTGWITTGSWTVPGSGPPTVLSALPASGSGLSQTFTLTVADGAGAGNISYAYFLVNAALSAAGGCYVEFNHVANTFRLQNDSGSGWLGPITLGANASLSNSQCTITGNGASSIATGNDLAINIPTNFTFSGVKTVFGYAYDSAFNGSGWITTGSWTVPTGPPVILSAYPASGSGSAQTFTLTVADGSGAANISYAYFLVNSSLSASGGCFVEFNHVPNTFRLQNDAGSGWLGPITLGTNASLSNSQCTITGNGASSIATGNSLAITIPTTFSVAFGGAKTVYAYAYDSAFNGSGWITTGSWTVASTPPPIPEPTPPPFTPNTSTGGFNTLQGILRVKASPDECYLGLGQNVKWDFINQSNPSQPCGPGKIPKVNQGYVWGSALINGVAYYGTTANAQCIGEGGLSKNPTPYQTDTWACEFGLSAYAQPNGPLPAQIGDQRPPRMYAYNLATHAVQDITPKLGGNPGSVCTSSGSNPLCVDQLWLSLRGVRTATSYTEPATGRTYLIVSGPALVQGSNAEDFFAYDIVAQKWVAKYQYVGYSDMRHWITVNGVLYAPVGKPNSAGGALVQYTGNFAALPTVPPPGPSNNFNQIPVCGTTSQTIPPAPPGAFQCFAFQDVADFDGVGTDAVLHEGRIFVGTWPPPGYATIWMSPPIPAGGFGTPTQAPAPWTKVWDLHANYDPDPVVAATIGTGAMRDFNGVLYWGTMAYGPAGTLSWLKTYGVPSNQQVLNEAVINTFRSATVFSGTNFTTGTPTINLLYGQSTFFVYNPTTQQWVATPNNMGGTKPAFGPSGFGNPYNNYIWTMAEFNNKLYVGTMDWSYIAADAFYFIKQSQGQPLPDITKLIPPQQYGADLYSFSNTTSAAVAESVNGLGNYLNYGVRAILVNGSASLLLGTANPQNTATTSTTAPHGGWELIEATPGTQGVGR